MEVPLSPTELRRLRFFVTAAEEQHSSPAVGRLSVGFANSELIPGIPRAFRQRYLT